MPQNILFENDSEQASTGYYHNQQVIFESSCGDNCLEASGIEDKEGLLGFDPDVLARSMSSNDVKTIGLDRSRLAYSTQFNENAAKILESIRKYDSTRLKVPSLNILMMAVGTRGDIQPFIELGLVLQSHGHHVRLATHENFRSIVTSKGIDFFPIAGDPVAMSEFMVKTEGFILPNSPETIRDAPMYHAMMVDILHSCWDACRLPDPKNSDSRYYL